MVAHWMHRIARGSITTDSSESDDAGQAPPAHHRRVMLSRRRQLVIWTLIVLASVIALGSILTTWVDRQMLDQQSWRTASEELIQDPQVREALSVYVVNQLYDNVNVGEALGERLPADLKPLAGAVAGGLREPMTRAVNRLFEGPRVQQLFVEASALAQQKLVNVLENKTGNGISTGNGVVTLDLGQLVSEVGAELGLSQSVLDRIPPDAGVVTVMRSDQLATAQAAVRGVQVLSTALLVLVLGLFALAIWLARGERRRTLRNVGWAFVLVGLLTLVARRLTGQYAVDALTTPASHDAGRQSWLIGSSILGDIGWAAVFYGAVMVLAAVLAGPTASATAVRRWIAPVLNERPGIAWATVGGAYVLLVLWGPTHALRVLWGITLLGALLALGVWALRRETLREFPDAERVRLAGPLTARVRQAAPVAHGGRAGNGESAPASPPRRSPAAQLRQLQELRTAGALTDAEFDRAKRIALDVGAE
jgi:hypothetical protein